MIFVSFFCTESQKMKLCNQAKILIMKLCSVIVRYQQYIYIYVYAMKFLWKYLILVRTNIIKVWCLFWQVSHKYRRHVILLVSHVNQVGRLVKSFIFKYTKHDSIYFLKILFVTYSSVETDMTTLYTLRLSIVRNIQQPKKNHELKKKL